MPLSARMLDLELRSAVGMQDGDFALNWMRMAFVMEVSATVKEEFSTKSQSAMQNAKLLAERATFSVFTNELMNDQALHRTQIMLLQSDMARKKATFISTMEEYHKRSWDLVANVCDDACPTWFIKTADIDSHLPSKLEPWLDQAAVCPEKCMC